LPSWWLEPPAAPAHPLDDGTAVLLERSIDATAANLGPDARAYRRLVAPLVPEWDDLAADALGPLVRMPRHADERSERVRGEIVPLGYERRDESAVCTRVRAEVRRRRVDRALEEDRGAIVERMGGRRRWLEPPARK